MQRLFNTSSSIVPLRTRFGPSFLERLDYHGPSPLGLYLLLLSWGIRRIPKKGQTIWSLVCPAVCWALWLERNQRVFKRHCELAFCVYSMAKDFACFWALKCHHLGDYSVTSTKQGWTSFFLCNQSLQPQVSFGISHPFSLMKIFFIKKKDQLPMTA